VAAARGGGELEGRLLAGRYRVVEQLGRGGMGVVCRARDEVLGRDVAVKELRTFLDASGEELAGLRLRMQREARAAARIRHAGVISVYDVAEEDGRPIIVMELVGGPSLDDVLHERGVLDPREAAALGAEVADALGAAHAVGVLHRDVKPGNILLENGGRVVLTDFGIATMEDPSNGTTSTPKLTQSGQLVGSLDFLAPERAQGQRPGPASDIWSLGATLYAAVEGISPFSRTSPYSTMTAIVTEPMPEPRRAGPLAPVLRELMNKDARARPDAQRARQMLAAVAHGTSQGLQGAVAERPPTADQSTAMLRARDEQPQRPTRLERGWRPPAGRDAQLPPDTAAGASGSARGRRRLALVAAVVAVILAGTAAIWGMTGRSGPGNSGSGNSGPDNARQDAAQPVISAPSLPAASTGGRSAVGKAPAAGVTRTSTPPGIQGEPSAGGGMSTVGPSGVGGTSGGSPGSRGHTTPTTPAPTPRSAPPPAPPPPAPTSPPQPWKSCTYYSGTALTQYGDKGQRVVEVQCILQARGYSVGSSGVDGDFGAATKAAVEHFQRDHHLAVDGQVGVHTWSALRG
jgi:serine/threonine protein kinase